MRISGPKSQAKGSSSNFKRTEHLSTQSSKPEALSTFIPVLLCDVKRFLSAQNRAGGRTALAHRPLILTLKAFDFFHCLG